MVMNAQTLIFYEKNEQGREIPRIYMGYDKDKEKYVFEVYNKEGQGEIHMNDDGNVIFSGTIQGGKIESDTDINVTKDATIGQKIILQDKNEATIGYEEAGIISVSEGVMQILANNNRSINLHTDGNVNLNGKSIMANGKEVATQSDLNDIMEEFKNLKNRISILENK